DLTASASVSTTIPIRTESDSKFAYAKAWYHMVPYPNRLVNDSCNLYSYDFHDTIRLLFSHRMSDNATFAYSKDSKAIIVHDSGRAQWINSTSGALESVIDPYIVTDTLFSPDSSLKAFHNPYPPYDLIIFRKGSGIYSKVLSQDSTGKYIISPDWKFAAIESFHYDAGAPLEYRRYDVVQLDAGVTNLLRLDHRTDVSTMSISPDSKYFVRSSSCRYCYGDTISIFNLQTRSPQTQIFVDSSQMVYRIFFIGSQLYIASIGTDPTHGAEYPNLRRWEYPSFSYDGRILGAEADFVCFESGVLDISSGSSKLLSSPDCGTIDVWDLKTGDSVWHFPSAVDAHFSETGDSIFVVYMNDPILRIWDFAAGKIVNTISQNLADTGVAFPIVSKDGKFFYYLDDYFKWPRLVVSSTQTGKRIIDKQLDYEYGYYGRATAFSSDDKRMAILGQYDSVVYIYDLENGALVSLINLPQPYDVIGHLLRFSPNNSKLVIWFTTYYGGIGGGYSMLWDLDSSKWDWVGGLSARDINFSPDGKWLFLANNSLSYVPSDSAIAFTRDATTFQSSNFLGEDKSTFDQLAISADGKYLACSVGSGNTFAVYLLPDQFKVNAPYLPENNTTEISVFPNPSRGLLTIELGGKPVDSPELNMYDLIGRKVRNQKLTGPQYSIDVDASDLASGTYFVAITSARGIKTQKLSLMKN
ncbi:MAG: T9SS type A sorting domain-containing protein, partial [Bacteroidota bacterium]|nr:T9SS type A sorting domain-containing protein [Bacteroidota bacterium]